LIAENNVTLSIMQKASEKELPLKQSKELIAVLKARFEKHSNRHPNIEWPKVQLKLEANPGKLWSLQKMEETSGEPDVVGFDKKTDEYIFYDCSAESPKGRRSYCYDNEALNARKEHKPKKQCNGVRNRNRRRTFKRSPIPRITKTRYV
jgi:hypothetical protein